MAKKKTTKKTAADRTTTYSTRLNDEQREHLEQAASIAGVSASRFIRDATLRAAADVVNSAAPNDRAINAIAQRLADSIADQQASLEYVDEFGEISHAKAALNNGYLGMNTANDHEDDYPQNRLVSIRINSLNPQDVRQLKAMAQSCPFTLARTVLKALQGSNEPMPEFNPRSNPDSLLSD